MNKSKTIPLLAALSVVVGFLTSQGIPFLFGQTPDPMVAYSWTAPTTGAPVEYYVGERQEIRAEGDTNVAYFDFGREPGAAIPYAYGWAVRLRVAGVDSLGRQGIYSQWSAWWNDDGPPGQPQDLTQTLSINWE